MLGALSIVIVLFVVVLLLYLLLYEEPPTSADTLKDAAKTTLVLTLAVLVLCFPVKPTLILKLESDGKPLLVSQTSWRLGSKQEPSKPMEARTPECYQYPCRELISR